jgi:peptide/nickel transport system substrate-binding protein
MADQIGSGAFVAPASAQSLPDGGTLKVALRVADVSNPHAFPWIHPTNIVRQVCGYLTRTEVDNVTRPDLCSGWQVSDDLKTWTFTLKDITWHDGHKFTAEEAAWNIQHCLDEAVGSSVIGLMKGYMLKEIDKGKKDDKGNAVMSTELWDANAIQVKDEKTLVLNLKEPQIAVPEHLFHYVLFMLDPKESGKFGVGSNGTGAFSLAEFEEGRRGLVKAVQGRGAHLEAVEFIDLGDNAQAHAAALQSQQIHMVWDANIEQRELYDAMEHVKIESAVTALTGVARMRVDTKPFDQPQVRKAFRLATDPAQTLEIAGRGLGEVAEHHHVAPIHPEYFKLPPMNRDVAGAKNLLAEAGFPDGLDVEITCRPEPTWELSAVTAMVEQWKDAGIRAKINVVPSTKFWEIWDQVPLGFTEWNHRPLGIMVLALAYRSGVPWNESRYSNKQFDELLTKAEGTLDVKQRSEIMGEIEKIMQEDGPIVQPIWRSIFMPVDKKLLNFKAHPTRYIFCEQYALEV